MDRSGLMSRVAFPAASQRCSLIQPRPNLCNSRTRCRSFGVDVSQFEGAIDQDTGYRAVYIGLGLAATSFASTFFIAPYFKDDLKEPEEWKDIYEQLIAEKTVSITPNEALSKLEQNSVLLDVSLASKHEKRSAEGSINIPLYRPIEGWDPASTARRAAFTFFGIPGTERNPYWLDQVQDKIPKDKEIVVMCEMGGSLEKKLGLESGFQSRSLKAIHFLQKAGYKQIYHMKGGINEWIRENLPTRTNN